ncbi:MAG: twin-arginine translocase subunit TatB [Nitrospirae bacterium]|nr:twin-arginine translocase subunit TatB [Nitrospirota bacterium]
MFDIGMQELIVIFIVILLVFGPKRAPELGRAVGKALAELKRSFYDVKKQVETEFKESTSDIQEAKKSFDDLKKKFESGVKETIGINALQQPVTEIIEETDETEEEELEEKEEEEEDHELEGKEFKKEGIEQEKKIEKDEDIPHEGAKKEEGLDGKH